MRVSHASGFDAAEGDPLGGCRVTPKGYASMTQALITEIPSARGRVVLVLEGGYNLDSISQSFAACASKIIDHASGAAATAENTASQSQQHGTASTGLGAKDTQPTLSKGYQKTVNDVRRLHARYWKSLRGFRTTGGATETKISSV